MNLDAARNSPPRRALLLILLVGPLSAGGCDLQSRIVLFYEAALVLADIAAGEGPSRLKESTEPPSITSVAFSVEGRRLEAGLYLPGSDAPEAALVLIPGIVPLGKDDPRLVALATTLARARFAVLTPEIPGFAQLRVSPAGSRTVADALRFVVQRPDLAPCGQAGIGALSYAVGIAVLGALEKDVRDSVGFILAVGGYYDLPAAITYMTTGWFLDQGEQVFLEPDPYGMLVLAMSSIPHLHDPADRRIMRKMVQARLENPKANLGRLAAWLGPEGLAVYAVLANRDPTLTRDLLAALPSSILETINSLSLDQLDLNEIPARFIVVHGTNDRLIPFTEGRALAAAAGAARTRHFQIRSLLGHVDLHALDPLTFRFWREDLPDLWRLHGAVRDLLGERARADIRKEIIRVTGDARRERPSPPGEIAPLPCPTWENEGLS